MQHHIPSSQNGAKVRRPGKLSDEVILLYHNAARHSGRAIIHLVFLREIQVGSVILYLPYSLTYYLATIIFFLTLQSRPGKQCFINENEVKETVLKWLKETTKF